MIEADREIKRVGRRAYRITEGQCPQTWEGNHLAVRVSEISFGVSRNGVISGDPPVTKIANQNLASQCSEAVGGLYYCPWRIESIMGDEPTNEIAVAVED